jgi:nitrogen fixation/metabolism regulation signal transduction histidine kinase
MPTTANRRKVLSIGLGVCLLVLLTALIALNAFNREVSFLNPATTEQTFVFTGLSAVAFLLFVAVLVLLVRNVLKLYADQRSRLLGSRLRTRMLTNAVLVSLVPIAFMTLFSYGLMNRAVDRWFSQPVTEMRDDSNRIAQELSTYTAANARAEAMSIATVLPEPEEPATPGGNVSFGNETIDNILRLHEITLQNGFVIVFKDSKLVAGFHNPRLDKERAEVRSWLTEPTKNDHGAKISNDAGILAAAQRTDEPVLSVEKNDYALGAATTKHGLTVVVGLPMPYGMASTMRDLGLRAENYWTLFRERRQIRNLYMMLLLMMTGLAMFAAMWLALHLSKQITKPVESLADAMEAVAAGDYARRVEEGATEELGDLTRSFNHMAADLEGSRRAVEESTIQLSAANASLEARRSELETMIETIPNGVATLDPERRIILANRALSEMMDPGGQSAFLGHTIEEVLPAEVVEVLDRLIRRSHRMGSAASEIELTSQGNKFQETLNLLATVALLETPANNDGMRREHRGYVIVLENATELLRAQKQSAWKEVARRVAHEIKNPLTPISLSAEQIRRHIDRLAPQLSEHGVESPSPGVIRRSSEVISSSVESMRSLVDQFSALAEFPTAQPRPADLNTIIENSLALFAGRMQSIKLVRRLEKNLPLVMADPEALKRALSNLIDNAAEAMQTSLLRELRLTTCLHENGIVELTIADTGSGLTDEMRERLFLPYFSTKQRGTGLGLAIAGKIIQEHQGTIRAEKNVPAGAKFIIELRTAVEAEPEQPATDISTGRMTA